MDIYYCHENQVKEFDTSVKRGNTKGVAAQQLVRTHLFGMIIAVEPKLNRWRVRSPDLAKQACLQKWLCFQGHDIFHCSVLKLKGHSQRGFCCFRSITLTKSFCKATTKISNEFYRRVLTTINFLRIFGTRGIKSWKNGQFFSNFNPFTSMPSVATGDRKQFQYLQMVLDNKPRSLVLEFSW